MQVTAHSCVQGAVQCLLLWIPSHVEEGGAAEKDGEALRSQYGGVAASWGLPTRRVGRGPWTGEAASRTAAPLPCHCLTAAPGLPLLLGEGLLGAGQSRDVRSVQQTQVQTLPGPLQTQPGCPTSAGLPLVGFLRITSLGCEESPGTECCCASSTNGPSFSSRESPRAPQEGPWLCSDLGVSTLFVRQRPDKA